VRRKDLTPPRIFTTRNLSRGLSRRHGSSVPIRAGKMSWFVLRLLMATRVLLAWLRGLHKTNRAKVVVGEKAMSSPA
jgi:hypothetical protein